MPANDEKLARRLFQALGHQNHMWVRVKSEDWETICLGCTDRSGIAPTDGPCPGIRKLRKEWDDEEGWAKREVVIRSALKEAGYEE